MLHTYIDKHAHTHLHFKINMQNFVLPAMLPSVWPELQRRFPVFSAYLARTLVRQRPELASTLPEIMALAAETEYEGERDDDEYGDYID